MLFRQRFLTESRSLGRILTIRCFSASSARARQRLVILGSGWGGYNVLRSIDKKRWGMLYHFSYDSSTRFLPDVTILSPNTYFNFTPLLAGTAVGTLEFRCAVEPIRRYTPHVVCSVQYPKNESLVPSMKTYYQAWCDNIGVS